MKIAVVEQDPLLADLISFRLELLGHEVTQWYSATEMLAAIAQTSIDLLIIDTYQSDMQGCDAIQKVRSTHTSADLPILTLSIDTDLSLVEHAYRAGANDYLIMPFDPAILQRKTDALLLQKRNNAARR